MAIAARGVAVGDVDARPLVGGREEGGAAEGWQKNVKRQWHHQRRGQNREKQPSHGRIAEADIFSKQPFSFNSRKS